MLPLFRAPADEHDEDDENDDAEGGARGRGGGGGAKGGGRGDLCHAPDHLHLLAHDPCPLGRLACLVMLSSLLSAAFVTIIVYEHRHAAPML